jgi:RES domain-containing protein
MQLWRISNYVDLSGIGGVKASGRWHTRGKPIVYLADHPSSALLEMLVRMDPDLIPPTYTLLRIHVPDHIAAMHVDLRALPSEWRSSPAGTRQIGDRWLEQAQAALLRVPSAIAHAAENILLNPAHPSAREIEILEVIHAPFDPRLISVPKKTTQ